MEATGHGLAGIGGLWHEIGAALRAMASLLLRMACLLLPTPPMTSLAKPVFHRLSPSEAAAMIRSEPTATVFDVRDLASYQKAHVDGAAHLAEDRFPAWMRRLPKEAPVVIYCYHGNASQTFAQMFVDFRYSRVFSVDGGYQPLAEALVAAG